MPRISRGQLLFGISSIAILIAGTAILFLYWHIVVSPAKKVLAQSNHPAVHYVVKTDKGWMPDKITIHLHDTIVFSSTAGKYFWPASNIHPQHTIYPEFDPKQPVDPHKTWQFTFDKSGIWGFHDHLDANETGFITVLNEDGSTPPDISLDINACSKFTDYNQKQDCWDNQLNSVTQEKGLDAAFDFFSQLYKTEPDVPKECHGWGHVLGKAAYYLYKQQGSLTLRPETAFCGYGFYHGFLAELMKDTGDITQARKFCDYTVAQLQGSLSNIRDNCVHGIGHGAGSMLLEDPAYQGQFQKTVDKAVSICEGLYSKEYDLDLCYDGVFNQIYLDIFQSKDGFTFDAFMAEGDPFHDCQLQKDEYKGSCYVNVAGLFWKIFNYDVVAEMKYAIANTHDLPRNGPKVVARIAADRIQDSIVLTSHKDSFDACKVVPDYLYDACFQGTLNGFVQHGEPGNLHPKGYAYCDEPMFTNEQSNSCYETFTGMLRETYTKDQMVTACEYATKKRRVQTCDAYLNAQAQTATSTPQRSSATSSPLQPSEAYSQS